MSGIHKDAREKTGWSRFRRNPFSLAGLIIIVLVALLSFTAYLYIPDNSPHANSQHLEIAAKEPGFRCLFLKLHNPAVSDKQGFFSLLLKGRRSPFQDIPIAAYEFHHDSIRVQVWSDPDTGGAYIRSFHLRQVTDRDELDNSGLRDYIEREHLVKKRFLLGTDRFGRDLLSRIILGGRISISIGLVAVIISLLIGTVLGALAGYYRGRTDDLIMWFINVVWSVPTLLLVIALTMVLGKGFWQIFIAVGLTMWVEVARIVRGQVLSLREKEFVDAARVLGMSDMRILFRHIFPNLVSPLVIIAASNFATAILIEAGLSFLGIGVQPPIPSWGNMIRDHYGFIIVDKAYLAFVPGIAIMLLVLAFMMVGNGLRDSFDVKSV